MNNQEPIQILASSFGRAIKQYANRAVSTAQYDKSFKVKILGVNQQFLTCVEMTASDISSDPDIQRRKKKPVTPSNYETSRTNKLTEGLTEQEQTALIEKYSIPEKLEEGQESFYTFELDGAYYVLQSSAEFAIGEQATIRIPNGNWSKMYLETSKGGENNPQIFVQDTEPKADAKDGIVINEGDYWIVVDDDEKLNVQALKRFNGSEWELLCNIPEGGELPEIYVQAQEPRSGAHSSYNEGDIWIKIDKGDNAVSINRYEYSGSEGAWNWLCNVSRNVYIQADYPSEQTLVLKEGDYWVELDNDTDLNAVAIYEWVYVSIHNYRWEKICNIPEGGGEGTEYTAGTAIDISNNNVISLSFDNLSLAATTLPTDTFAIEDANGDIKKVNYTSIFNRFISTDMIAGNNITLTRISDENGVHVRISASKVGVGEALGSGNERFNDYSSNEVVGAAGGYNTLKGQNNKVSGSWNLMTGRDNLCMGSPEANIFFGARNQAGLTSIKQSLIGGTSHTFSIPINNSLICGNTVKMRNSGSINNSLMVGYDNDISGANQSLVCGESNTIPSYGSGSYSGIFDSILYGRSNIAERVFHSLIGGYNNQILKGTGVENAGGAENSIICGSSNVAQAITTEEGSSVVSSVVCGNDHTIEQALGSVVCGRGNGGRIVDAVVCGEYANLINNNPDRPFILVGCGSGTDDSERRNLFMVKSLTGAYCVAFHSSNADYAEYFEWLDGNPENEDRRGLLVTLDGDKIRLANIDDDIIGVISAAPSVIGNGDNDEWKGKYRKDIFGAELKDDEGHGILSEDYDKSREYTPRSKRPEWAAVGLVGRLVVVDNGECAVNKYCTAENGVAVPSAEKTNVRVLKRIDENHIEVLIK